MKCSKEHRSSACSSDWENRKCANCQEKHVSSYRVCRVYKEELTKAEDTNVKEQREKLYAYKALPIISNYVAAQATTDPIVILSAFAECLSSMAQFLGDVQNGKSSADSIVPFQIVSNVAKRYWNLDISPTFFACRSISDSPLKETMTTSSSQTNMPPLPLTVDPLEVSGPSSTSLK
jgi:predicted amidophosphoribosyltransferase